ncbi:MAG: hypothetical protein KKA65_02805 [Nanoarchaeota archaeon]|nr:hypothetical protein [Nanoarchaeota archaeon]MBU4351521.1 hypothetical protein [Nanoarchaeota archaeon]MBU4456407.1 hypothetical protein [Nanoarchaeota archaeon]MCG2719736.1 hypothetical protein [Nanoarchaeota archaeon]
MENKITLEKVADFNFNKIREERIAPQSLTFSPDGKLLAVASIDRGFNSLVNLFKIGKKLSLKDEVIIGDHYTIKDAFFDITGSYLITLGSYPFYGYHPLKSFKLNKEKIKLGFRKDGISRSVSLLKQKDLSILDCAYLDYCKKEEIDNYSYIKQKELKKLDLDFLNELSKKSKLKLKKEERLLLPVLSPDNSLLATIRHFEGLGVSETCFLDLYKIKA